MRLLKPLFLISCFLISLSFFDLVFVPDQIVSILQLIISPAILILLITLIVYQKGERIKSNFTIEIFLIFFSVILSMLGAYYFHGQSYKVTAIAQRAMYLFLFYFLLLWLKPEPGFMVKVFAYLGLFTAFVYLVQTVIYPFELVNSQMRIDRGTLRIFLPGIGYCVIAYFYFFNQYLNNLRFRDIAICILFLIIFVLIGTRQIIVPVFVMTMLNLILSKKIKSKFTVFMLGSLAVLPILYVFQDIFFQMFELSKSQSQNFDEDIRMRAIRFFTGDFFPNFISRITGNGVAGGSSAYAARTDYYMSEFGFYQSDVGIFGEYTKFGIIFVVVTLFILFKMVFMKVPADYRFLWYSNLINVVNISLGALMSVPDGIILLCSMLYMYDVSRYKEKIFEAEPDQT